MNNLELEKMANEIRKDIVTAVHSAKSGHPGGSLSSADIFTYLYFEEMNVDPANPKWEDRDRFVLSKGHVAPGLYSTLAEKGYFPKEDLKTLRHTGSYLQGHPDMKHIPGIDMSSGSLGQGVSAAVGMAAAGKYDKKDYRVYTLTGDGEIQEGQIWEAAMWAGHRKLDNLVVIVDNNNLQIDGSIEDVKRFLLPFVKREIKSILESGHTADYKSILQQIVQQEKGELLEYVLVEESGPAHKRIFTVEARLNNNVVGVGTAGNKREAEQIAAREALSLFGDDA